MTAPTAAEIRAIVETCVPTPFSIDDIGDWFDVIMDSDEALTRAGRDGWNADFYPDADHPGTVWADLTEAEGKELHRLLYAAINEAERAFGRALIEGVTAAAVAFAEAHPDAPRGRYVVEPELVSA